MADRNGFTLIELLVVISIISVTLAVVGPRLAGRIEGAALRDSAADLQTLAKAGRGRAALTGRQMALRIGPAGGEITLLEQQAAGNEKSWRAVTPWRRIAEGVSIRVQKTGNDEADRDEIRFRPDGTVDAAGLILRDNRGGEMRLESITALGRIRVVAQP